MVLARNAITVSKQRDIESITWFYLLQSSTLSPPAKPTTLDPGGTWSASEPAYAEGSTNSLYVVERTVFTDGTFSYSDVSQSSSYEAAKAAYNKAAAAQAATEPIDSKTYTGLIGTANSFAGANFFFGKIYPESYTASWRVKMRITVEVPATHTEVVDIEFGGYGSTFSSYDAYVSRAGSMGFFYVYLFRATQAGFSAGVGHMIGISLASSSNPATASYARTVKVDLLATYACTTVLNDTAVKYTAMSGYSTTNYGSGTTNATPMRVDTAGQNATNSIGSYTDTVASYGGYVKAGPHGIFAWSLVMEDAAGGTWSSFTLSTSDYTSTTKEKNPGGFRLGKVLRYYGTSTLAAGKTAACYDCTTMDFRYSSNCGSTLVAAKPVYLVGTLANDGFFYLDDVWWTQTEPTTDDGKVYIYLGMALNNGYQLYLTSENPVMRYHNGEFVTMTEAEIAESKSIANGKNAVFYQATAPTGTGHKEYDVWFDTSSDNKMYYWDGTQWTAKQFGTQAIADSTVTAALIAADAVTADKIVAGAVTTAKIATGAVTANEIAANAVTAAKIDVSELSAISANLGTITGGTLRLGVSGSTEVTKLNPDGTGHIGAWNFDATKLYNGTYGSDGSLHLSTANMASKAIGGRTGADWRLTVGSKFGVTNTGAVYCSDIHANGGTLGDFTFAVSGHLLYADSVSIGTGSGDRTAFFRVNNVVDNTITASLYGSGLYLSQMRTIDGHAVGASLADVSYQDNNADGYYGGRIGLMAGTSTGYELGVLLDGEAGTGLFLNGAYEGSIDAAHKLATRTDTRYLNYVTFSSSAQAHVPNVTGGFSTWKSWLIIGFIQNIGSVMLAVFTANGGQSITVRNLNNNSSSTTTVWTSNGCSIYATSDGMLVLTHTASGQSSVLVITI